MGQENYDRQTAWGRKHGLRPRKERTPCPRVLARKLCLVPWAKKRDIEGEQVFCICQHSKVRELKDHERVWTWTWEREPVITFEPYAALPQPLQDMRNVLKSLDVEVKLLDAKEWAWTEGTRILVLTHSSVDVAEMGF